MFDLDEIFEKLDQIDDVEKLTEMKNSIKDPKYTKMFWKQQQIALRGDTEADKARARLKCALIAKSYSASIPVKERIKRFITPHGFAGIHISAGATIGKGCILFQHVVIGSNTLLDSKSQGFPVIGNNVFFGAGSMVIGNVNIGNNVRIGANCIVTKDVPDNCLVVGPKAVVIQRDKPMDNKFVPYYKYVKMQADSETDGNEETEDAVVIGKKDNDGKIRKKGNHSAKNAIYMKMSDGQQQKFANAFKILFAGDLILLEDQVKNAYDGSGYNFDLLFEYTKSYISSADLAIGVFEGPMGGEEAGYSTSNYEDGKKLAISFPDSFAQAVQNSGFDLVTTANNHLLDKGVAAAERTLDVLDSLKLDHIGSYRSQAEKEANCVKILEKDGIKIAVLAYTFRPNKQDISEFVNGGKLSYITSVLVNPAHPYFEEVKESVKKDFEQAKKYDPDLIVVLPHMGKQFVNVPNNYQKTWCSLFYEYGADIILGDHTHSVQPIEIFSENGKTRFTAYCPGNYANIYRKHNGDATSLIEVYIDRQTKKVIGGAIVPMWVQSQIRGNYRALPIYEILNDEKLGMEISTRDLLRVKAVHAHITKVMLRTKLDISMIRDRYYFTQDGFFRTPSEALDITGEMRSGVFFTALAKAESVCFIGDSVTEGTKNGGYPWYEPLENLTGKIFNWSKGGGTTVTLLDNIDKITSISADLYVIAIGTNDVRYRNDRRCAMTVEEYTANLEKICDAIKRQTPSASFVLIAPWISTDGDAISKLTYPKKVVLNQEYSQALKLFCEERNFIYIDANPYIGKHLERYPSSRYLLDHIHPNSTDGIRLYSEAVMLYKE